MKVEREISAFRSELAVQRSQDRRVGLVPTMGCFHEGHLSLIRAARAECEVVVVSSFLNPAQFRPGEDLSGYPQSEERDRSLASECGVDILFLPDGAEMYGDGFKTSVAVSELNDKLCGEPGRRGPEHFNGVTTVVTKLFNIVQPDIAYFGQKDAQQARVIERMVEDLNFPVELKVLPTIRDESGLALSSRNSYLTAEERARAAEINRSLVLAEQLISSGERDPERIDRVVCEKLREAGVKLEYFEIVDSQSLKKVDRLEGEVLIAVATYVGMARLIDNSLVQVPEGKEASAVRPREVVNV